MLYVFLCDYLPYFNDGRVRRTEALVEFLRANSVPFKVVTFGHDDDLDGDILFLKSRFRNAIADRKDPTKQGLGRSKYVLLAFRFIERCIPFDRYLVDVARAYWVLRKFVKPTDSLYISVPWFSALFIGLIKCEQTFIDFRDLLVGNPIFSKFEFLEVFLIKFLLRKDAKYIVTTAAAQQKMQMIFGRPGLIVSNGITLRQERFISDEIGKATAKVYDHAHHKMVVRYFGNLGGKRKVFPILDALLDQGVDLQIYGHMSAEYIEKFGSNFHGRLEWEEMIQKQISADVVLVCITRDEDSDHAIPGKIFETVRTGSPILLYCPQGAAAKSFLEAQDYRFIWVNSDLNKVGVIPLDNKRGRCAGCVPPIREYEFKGLLEYF